MTLKNQPPKAPEKSPRYAIALGAITWFLEIVVIEVVHEIVPRVFELIASQLN